MKGFAIGVMVFVSALCTHVFAQDQPSFRLVTSYSSAPPTATLVGSSSTIIADCVFNELNVDYEMVQLPWLRAHMQLTAGLADGILPMTRQQSLDEIAVRSAPFGLEKWYWFSRGDTSIKSLIANKDTIVGTLRGSNHALWLSLQGYTNVMEVESVEQLHDLLKIGRVDLVFFELQWGLNTYGETIGSRSDIHFLFERYATLGMYVSKSKLKQSPGFLKQFNSHIKRCHPEWVTLTEVEINLLKSSIFEPLALDLLNSEQIRGRLQEIAAQTPKDTLAKMDEQWQSELTTGNYKLIKTVLDNEISILLRDQVEKWGGSIAELIITDRFGANVAVSHPTSDYWQGDENKFRVVVKAGFKTYFGPMEFDASTGRFQAQISSPILNSTGDFIGVLIVGVDVERALEML